MDRVGAWGCVLSPETHALLRSIRDYDGIADHTSEWRFAGCPDSEDPVAPGGDMPAPFPGMWVLDASGVTSAVRSFWQHRDGWYFDIGDDHLHESDVTAIYDGRREIWRRA